MKVKKILCISLIIVILITNLTTTYAKFLTENEKVHLVQDHTCVSLLKMKGKDTMKTVVYVYYAADGKKYPAFCVQPEKPGVGMGGGDSYDVTVNQIEDNVLWRMLYKGYMGSSYQSWGLECDDDLYYATKVAVHSMAEGVRPVDKYEVATRVGKFDTHLSLEEVQRRSAKVLQVAQAIYDFGYSGTENYIKPQVSIAKKGNLEEKTISGTKYVVQSYSVTANKELGSYKVSIINFPSGTKILNNSNVETQNMTNSTFSIAIPTNNISANIVGDINITEAKVKTYPIFYADSKNESTQNYVTYADPSENGSAITTLSVEAYNSTLQIKKTDESGAAISGAIFNVKYADGTNIGNYTTNAQGIITIKNLKQGNVIVKEVSVPGKYVLDTTERTIKLEYNSTSTLNVTNNTRKGYIEVIKKDSKTGKIVKKAGTEFEILSNNNVVSTIKTNSNGIAKSSLLEYGTYTVREKTNPQNYMKTTVTTNVNVYENNKTYQINISNEPVLGQINLTKSDKETGNTVQGDATFKGATYVLKANENILDPADGSVLYKKDEVISKKAIGTGIWGDTGTKTIDNNYKIQWNNLPMGNYRIEESIAGNGYLLDNSHAVTLTSTSSSKSLEIREVNSQEQVKKGYIEVTKKDSKTGKVVKKAGTEFEILYKNNVISTIKTDSNGVAKSNLLPYGTYVVREKTNPQNYIKTTVTTSLNVYDNNKTYNVDVSNEPVLGQINLTKTDKETGNTVQGDATFKGATYVLKANENILDPADGSVLYKKDEVISKKTVGTGSWGDTGTKTIDGNNKIQWNNLPMGSFRVEEVQAPTGYLLDNSHVVTLTSTSSSKSLEIREVNSQEQVKKGFIQVVKKDKDTGKIVKQEGTEFEVLYQGKVIRTIKTNANGVAKTDLLPYGSYTVREKLAPYKYTKTTESKSVNVYENNQVYEIEFSNKRVVGEISINKIDNVTGNKAQGEAALEGAVYGVYARTPILDPADGSVIYNTDEEVGELVTDKNACATLKNLYLGEFYLLEKIPSKGYTLDTTKYNFDLIYENQNTSVVTQKVTVQERVISQAFQMIKVSSDTNGEAELLKGVEFTIKSQKDIEKYGSWEKAPIAKNADGKEAAILVTDEKGYAISERLPYGTYIVRETKVPDDKYKVPDFKVVITKDSDEPQTWRIFNDTSFKSVLAIVKRDAETQKIVQIAGANFKIKNIETGEYFGYWAWNPLPHYVDKWETDATGTVMTGEELLPGKYQLEELESPERIFDF